MIYAPQLFVRPIESRRLTKRHGLYYGRTDGHGMLVGCIEFSEKDGQWKTHSIASNYRDSSPTLELASKSLMAVVKSEMKEVSKQ
jgi:hypothetical protein